MIVNTCLPRGPNVLMLGPAHCTVFHLIVNFGTFLCYVKTSLRLWWLRGWELKIFCKINLKLSSFWQMYLAMLLYMSLHKKWMGLYICYGAWDLSASTSILKWSRQYWEFSSQSMLGEFEKVHGKSMTSSFLSLPVDPQRALPVNHILCSVDFTKKSYPTCVWCNRQRQISFQRFINHKCTTFWDNFTVLVNHAYF